MSFVDSAEREIIETGIGRALFVEAGAGTGKTTEMVARITGLLCSGGAEVSSIVAITFTEAAAGELRERLRSSLESVRSKGPEAQASRAATALLFLEDAAIQTIHGFAHRIVSRFAVQAGVPPSFEVQDRIKGKLLNDERWRLFMRQTFSNINSLDSTDQILIRTATALGLNQNQFRGLALALQREWQKAIPASNSFVGAVPRVDVTQILVDARVALEFASKCKDESDRMVTYLSQTLMPWVRRLLAAHEAQDDLAILEALSGGPSFKVSNRGAKGNWSGDCLKELRALLGGIGEDVVAALSPTRQWALAGVVRMLSKYVVAEARYRRSNGLLEFHDLLVYALDLARMPVVAQALRSQYNFLFVDEFQDTDALQVELIACLTEAADGDAGAELFTVGDSKQSIYRFRGADLEQFHAVRQGGRAEVVKLSTNFRTVPTVLRWINGAFETLVNNEAMGEWAPLAPARLSEDAELGSVHTVGEAVDGLKARDVRELEAAEVVARITQAKQEHWLVEAGGVRRPIQFGDMATLMPTRRSLPALERELRAAKVPYRVESRSLIWSTQEIRDVTSILRAVANPRDEVALVAALRTPALGCGDDDLLTWRQGGGLWAYQPTPAGDATQHPVGRALARLAALHELQQWTPVSQFVSELISQMRMYELAFARPRQREAWHRLRFVVDRARAWTEAGGYGLHSFVQWIETQEEEAADAVESVVPEADDDAVRIMTIHASKGLEFPMVVLVGLGSIDSITDSARLLWGPRGQCEVRIGSKAVGWETAGFTRCEGFEAERNAEEQARLLYVAATRARDHLVVSLYRTAGGRSGQSLAARLSSVVGESRLQDIVQSLQSEESSSTSKQLAGFGTDYEEKPVRAEVIANGSRSLSLSATAIATQVAGVGGLLPVATVGSKDTDAIDLSERLRFGSAVHAALEILDLQAAAAEVEVVALQQARAFDLTHRLTDINQSIALALQSEHVAAALKSGRYWREVSVFTTVGDRVIGGSIDLLYESEGELVVVDYKTEEVPNDEASAHALDRYRWQIITYALACQSTTGLRVRNAALLFIPPTDEHATSISAELIDESIDSLINSVLPSLL